MKGNYVDVAIVNCCHRTPMQTEIPYQTALNILFSKSTREAEPKKKKKVYDRAKLTAVTGDAVDTDLL